MAASVAKTRELKTNYKVDVRQQAFFTGGKLQITVHGQHLFCPKDHEINLLDVETGKSIHIFKIDEGDTFNSLAVSPDDQTLVAACRSGQIQQWSLGDREKIRTWKSIHKGPISRMAFDSTSTLLATGGIDATIKIWDIVRKYCTHNLKGASGVFSCVVFHPEMTKYQVFGTADDYGVCVWDLLTGTLVSTMKGHMSTITALQFSDDHQFLFSAGRDKVVIQWKLDDYSAVKTIPIFESVEGMVLLPTSKAYPLLNIEKGDAIHFVTAGEKGVLKVWNAERSSNVYKQELEYESEEGETMITQLIFNRKCRRFIATNHEHNIQFFRSKNLTLAKQFVGFNDEVLSLRFYGDRESHLAVATNSPIIKCYEISTMSCQLLRGHTDIVLALDVFTTDQLMLASCSKDNNVRLWRMNSETGCVTCIAVASGHTHQVLSVACSKLCSSFIVSVGQDQCLKLWDLPTKLRESNTPQPTSLRTRFTKMCHEKGCNAVCVSRNDKLLATGSQDKTAKLWNLEDGEMLSVLRGHTRGVWAVTFSPVDQILATASADCTIKLWAISDSSCVKTFQGHESSVLTVGFLTRGMQLISSGSDGLIKLWTVNTNECISTLDEHQGKVWSLDVSADESRIVTGADESAIFVWKDVTSEEKEEEVQKKEEVILQQQELDNLLHDKQYYKALSIAINLGQPFRALKILKEIVGLPEGTEKLVEIIKTMDDNQLDSLLKFAAGWNTNSKHCHQAQLILSLTFKTRTHNDLLKMPSLRSGLEGFIPYTERHLNRLDRLAQQTTFLDYTWECMRITGTNEI